MSISFYLFGYIYIKITPQMIEAGEAMILSELGGTVTSFFSAPDLAVLVYRAMARLSYEGRV